MASEEGSEPLKYQTWALRVSIHCEGCKRKVKRVLQSVDGVYTIAIDAQKHKVVVTGNVDAGTLIRKLEKNGKHAELWPEKKLNNPNANPHPANPNPKNKKKQPQNPNESAESPESKPIADAASAAEPSGETPKPPAKPAASESSTSALPPLGESSEKSPTAAAPNAGGGKRKKKKKHKKPKPADAGNPTTAATAAGAASSGEAESENEPEKTSTPASAPAPAPALTQAPPVAAPPRQHPPVYYASQAVLSYNTAQPAAGYGGTYYLPSAAVQEGYVYSGGWPEGYYGQMEPTPVERQSSYDMFSEENANFCNVM